MCICFLVQGLAGENPILISFASLPLMFPVFFLSSVIPKEFFDKDELMRLVISLIVSLVLSALAYFTNQPKWMVLVLPTYILVAMQIKGSIDLWKKNKGALARIYAALLFIAGLQVASFPFSRFIESFAPIGFTMGICLAVSFAIVLPSFIIESYLKQKNLEKDKQYETLFNILSHDISNPLTSLGGSLTLLFTKKDLEPKQVSILRSRANRAHQNMVDILNHVRELREVESKGIKVEFTKVDIINLLRETLDDIEDRLEVKKITVEHNLSEAKPCEVLTNRETLKNQVLLNILSNALKFSEQDGKIKITLDHTGSEVILAVKDFGKGIAQKRLDKLFDFKDNSTTEGTLGEKGTGLGMPIMKRYCDALKIEVNVESKVGEDSGTLFVLKWMLA